MKAASTLLLIIALWLVQCLAGGTRPAYCIVPYGILAIAALLSAFSLRTPSPGPRPNLACLVTTAIVFAYMLIRAFFSTVDYLWWMDFYLVLACLVVFLLSVFQITGPGLRMMVVLVLLVLAVTEFIIAIRQFKVGDNWMPFGLSRPSTGARASGTFISPIQLAGYLEAVGAMAASLTVWTSWKGWVRIVFGYMAVVCYAGVAISGSRGGYMSSLFRSSSSPCSLPGRCAGSVRSASPAPSS